MPNKKCITVDTCVLCRADSVSNEESHGAVELLNNIYRHCDAIVLDKPQNRILKEYRGNIGRYSGAWLESMLRRQGKFRKVLLANSRPIPHGVAKDCFDSKFVRVCSLTDDRLLISSDRKFWTAGMMSYLKSAGIRILGIDEALKTLDYV